MNKKTSKQTHVKEQLFSKQEVKKPKKQLADDLMKSIMNSSVFSEDESSTTAAPDEDVDNMSLNELKLLIKQLRVDIEDFKQHAEATYCTLTEFNRHTEVTESMFEELNNELKS